MPAAPSDPATAHPKPDGIVPDHLRADGPFERHASPLSLLVLSAVMALGLSGWVGKPWPERSLALGEAELAVEMPEVISTGDLYEARIHVRARSDIGKLQIGLAPGLWKEITVNSTLPGADAEVFADGYFRYEFAALKQGEAFLFKIDAQVNPRFFGALAGDIRVYDDGRLLATSPRALRVMP